MSYASSSMKGIPNLGATYALQGLTEIVLKIVGIDFLKIEAGGLEPFFFKSDFQRAVRHIEN